MPKPLSMTHIGDLDKTFKKSLKCFIWHTCTCKKDCPKKKIIKRMKQLGQHNIIGLNLKQIFKYPNSIQTEAATRMCLQKHLLLCFIEIFCNKYELLFCFFSGSFLTRLSFPIAVKAYTVACLIGQYCPCFSVLWKFTKVHLLESKNNFKCAEIPLRWSKSCFKDILVLFC